MAITLLPTPPSRQDPANFNVRADKFLGALPTFGTEANSLATDVNNKQVTASNAATTATSAESKATTKAGEALSSANDAATSASNANAAKLAAEAALDSFDDRYLGAKSIPPTTDNDGNPLMVGALYWSTATSEMKAWSGSAWVVTYGNLDSKYDKTGGTITGSVLVQRDLDGTTSIDVSNTNEVGLNAAAGLTLRTGVAAIGYMQMFKLLNELQIGTSTNTSVGLYINGNIALRVGTDKSILATGGALGYGAGAGGTVVQTTSKSTAVTLNKPTGQIAMHSAPLPAGASVSFVFNNSFLGAYDGMLIRPNGFIGYSVEVEYSVAATSVVVRVTNRGATRSDPLALVFQIIKGALS